LVEGLKFFSESEDIFEGLYGCTYVSK
jgi:hypothetical protein